MPQARARSTGTMSWVDPLPSTPPTLTSPQRVRTSSCGGHVARDHLGRLESGTCLWQGRHDLSRNPVPKRWRWRCSILQAGEWHETSCFVLALPSLEESAEAALVGTREAGSTDLAILREDASKQNKQRTSKSCCAVAQSELSLPKFDRSQAVRLSSFWTARRHGVELVRSYLRLCSEWS